MNIDSKLFTFPFESEKWAGKLAVAALIGLVGLFFSPALLPLLGYAALVMRQVMAGEQPRLPEWQNWGELFRYGLWYVVIALVYFLPFILLIILMIAILMPLSILPMVMVEGSEEAAFIGPILAQLLIFACITPLSLLAIPLQMLSMIGMGMALEEERLGAAFDFGRAWGTLRSNVGPFLLAYGLYFVMGYAIGIAAFALMITIILIPVAFGLLAPLSYLYLFTLFGLAYRTAKEKRISPAAPAPAV